MDCLDREVYYSLPNAPDLKSSTQPIVYGVDEKPVTCYGMIRANVSITHNGITLDLEIDLHMINCGSQEGIFGRPFRVNHRAVLNAGSGYLLFNIQG